MQKLFGLLAMLHFIFFFFFVAAGIQYLAALLMGWHTTMWFWQIAVGLTYAASMTLLFGILYRTWHKRKLWLTKWRKFK